MVYRAIYFSMDIILLHITTPQMTFIFIVFDSYLLLISEQTSKHQLYEYPPDFPASYPINCRECSAGSSTSFAYACYFPAVLLAYARLF